MIVLCVFFCDVVSVLLMNLRARILAIASQSGATLFNIKSVFWLWFPDYLLYVFLSAGRREKVQSEKLGVRQMDTDVNGKAGKMSKKNP